MIAYILRRLIFAIPVLLGILLVTFLLSRMIPGDPCVATLGERATEAQCAEFLQRFGFDQPLPNQFMLYVGNILGGNLGNSVRYSRPVSGLIAERLPVTVELAFTALLFAVIVGVPLGIVSAYYRNSAIDVATMIGANIGVSMPVFWLGLLLAYLFAVILKDTPLALPSNGRLPPGMNPDVFYVLWGWADSPASAGEFLQFLGRLNILNGLLTLNFDLVGHALRHLILPAVTVGTIPLAIIARMTRSSVLETLGQDYVRTARAKGLAESTVVNRHAVRNALLPVVTVIGLNFGGLISGAVLTETIFQFGGVGRTLVESITARDYPLVQGFTLFIAVAFVMVNLITDVVYVYLDPRIRLN